MIDRPCCALHTDSTKRGTLTSMPRPPEHAPPYRHVAWVYDALASAYSLGAIDRAKQVHHALIKPGDKVLYAGAGRGREIAGALPRGAEVTCVEPCPAMALRLHDRLASHGERFTIVPRPIQAVTPLAEYDHVVAHFFLNVFDEATMPEILQHLCKFVKPGGSLVIADFKPSEPTTNRITKSLRATYYRPLNLAGWLLRICALHPIYDYAPVLKAHGFEVKSNPGFELLPGTPSLYHTIIASRPEAT